jgi:hypothetical protein
VIIPSQEPLLDNTQHSQETNIHAPCRFRTRSPSKRAATDPRLRPRCHWDRHKMQVLMDKSTTCHVSVKTGNISTAEKATIIALLYYCYKVTPTRCKIFN